LVVIVLVINIIDEKIVQDPHPAEPQEN